MTSTEPTRRARYEVFEDSAGQYRFRLVAVNGEIVGPASQGYRDRTDARRGVEAHLRAALATIDNPAGDGADVTLQSFGIRGRVADTAAG